MQQTYRHDLATYSCVFQIVLQQFLFKNHFVLFRILGLFIPYTARKG